MPPVGSGTAMGWGALLAFGEETTWGTKISATSLMEFRSETFKKTIKTENLNSLGGNRAHLRRVQTEIDVTGSLVWDLHPVDGIKLLKHALMGTVTSTQVGATVAWIHSFGASDLTSITQKGLSFDVRPSADTTTAFQFYGCRVNTWKLTGIIGQPVRCEMSFIGKDATSGAFLTTTGVFSPVRPFLFQDGTFFLDGTIASITAASNEQIIGFELMVNENLQTGNDTRSIGDQSRTALPVGPRDISLKLTQRFDTTTAWTRFLSNSQAAIRLRLDTGQTIGAALTTYAMFIDLPKVFYDTYNMPVNNPNVLTYDVDISAISDTVTSAGNNIGLTLTNSVTTYA